MTARRLAGTGTQERLATLGASFALLAVVVVLAGPGATAILVDPVRVLDAMLSTDIEDRRVGWGAFVAYILLPSVGVLLGVIAGARRDPVGGWLASLAGAVLLGAVMGLAAPGYVTHGQATDSAGPVVASLGGALVMAQDFLLFCTLPFAIAATLTWALVHGPARSTSGSRRRETAERMSGQGSAGAESVHPPGFRRRRRRVP